MKLFMANNALYIAGKGMVAVLLMLATGCTNTPTRFFMLNADPAQAASGSRLAFKAEVVVGLGAIHIPDYLNRPQLVIETQENQYRIDEQSHWAERLDQNIRRSLTLYLQNRLGLQQMPRYPWSTRQVVDYQVDIDVLALHQTAAGYSLLQAQWQIKHQEQTRLSRHFECSIPTSTQPEAIVKAQSTCLGQLGVEIEQGIRQVAE